MVFPARSALFNHNILNTKAISHFQANHILIRFVFPPLTLTDSSGAETKITEDLYVVNAPSRLTFIIPAGLADGTYELKVTTQFSGSGSKLLKTPHSAAKTIYIGKAPEGGGGSSGGEEENPLG